MGCAASTAGAVESAGKGVVPGPAAENQDKPSAPSKYVLKHGPFYIDGELTEEQLKHALEKYGVKGWLYLNKEELALRGKVEAAGSLSLPEPMLPLSILISPDVSRLLPGVKWACVPLSPDKASQELANELVAAIDKLPKPTMIQCSTGKRAGAALALYLSKDGGSPLDIASTLNLPCMDAQVLRNWLGSTSIGVIFRQLFDAQFGSSTYTYILADPITKEAVIIDPVVELVDRDLGIVEDLGLKLVYAINTHCHADHITGTGEIKKRLPSVKSGIAEASGAKADIHYRPGDVVTVGSISLEVRPTPGHTDGCVSYYTKSGGGMVFTGDAVLIRGCGRTDFQQGSPETLYASVHEQIFTLPDSTKLYPAHDYKGRTSSTVGEEKRLNPRLSKPLEEFVSIMNNLNLPKPAKIDASLPANLQCGITD
mmetsp:Transcript_11421/g.27101  ORF Transcript_11421/g.27101 Transcript_11421/m.27101 type:complete len:426 (+) Transcript_11421:102-1379(+)